MKKRFLLLALILALAVAVPVSAQVNLDNGYDAYNRSPYSLLQSNKILPVVLSAGISQTVAIPTGSKYVLMAVNGGNDFYMLLSNASNTSIAVPTVTSASASGPELNPLLRTVVGYTYISLISPANCVITLSYFK